MVRCVGFFDLLKSYGQNNAGEGFCCGQYPMLSTSFLGMLNVQFPSRSFLARKRVTNAPEAYGRSDKTVCVYEHLTYLVRVIVGPTSLADPGPTRVQANFPTENDKLFNTWKCTLGLSDLIETNLTIAGNCSEN